MHAHLRLQADRSAACRAKRVAAAGPALTLLSAGFPPPAAHNGACSGESHHRLGIRSPSLHSCLLHLCHLEEYLAIFESTSYDSGALGALQSDTDEDEDARAARARLRPLPRTPRGKTAACQITSPWCARTCTSELQLFALCEHALASPLHQLQQGDPASWLRPHLLRRAGASRQLTKSQAKRRAASRCGQLGTGSIPATPPNDLPGACCWC